MNLRAASVALVLVCGATSVRAQEDYKLDSTAWNGLSDLVSVAASSGLTLDARSTLAWSEIGPNDVLFIVYPTTHVEPSTLVTFLRGGGRALIADDFGRADEALARLGVLRHRHVQPVARVFDQNPNLPIAVPLDGSHVLAQGVAELVTNHPSAFVPNPGIDSVFGYSKAEPVVVSGSYGNGRFVALSDPSVLINDMLAFDGNLAFAANILHDLAPLRPGRVFVVTGDTIMTGEPRPAPDGIEPLSMNEALTQVGSFLDELNDYVAPDTVLRSIGVVGGLLVLFGAALALPIRRSREPDASFARVHAEPASIERLVLEFDDETPDRNFAFPAAVLRENVEPELEARLGSQPQNARPATLKALELVRRLPPRTAAFTLAAHVNRKAFFQAYDAAQAALSPSAKVS